MNIMKDKDQQIQELQQEDQRLNQIIIQKCEEIYQLKQENEQLKQIHTKLYEIIRLYNEILE